MNLINEEFELFTSIGINRLEFITSWLSKNQIPFSVLKMNQDNHILIQFDEKKYDSAKKIKTIVSHYDIAKNTFGCNDNSFCVWFLMNYAKTLNEKLKCGNVRILFTDGEERGFEDGQMKQGSFTVAKMFKEQKLFDDDIFIFDSCGRGTVPILCMNSFSVEKIPISELKKMEKFVAKNNDLNLKMNKLLFKAVNGNFLYLPFAYSDNASFLSMKIPCVTITFLPYDEAVLYSKSVSSGKNDYIPPTWKMFHTFQDDISSLTPESSQVLERIIDLIVITNF